MIWQACLLIRYILCGQNIDDLLMKKMILGICYLFLTQYLTAQISGKVTDASQTPIAAATVELSNGLSTLTTESGSFEFKKVKPGNYTLQVTSVGYQSANQQVSTGSPIDIKLERLNLFLQPVEIKATRADDKAPFTKSNLSKKEIEKLNLGQDLPFILNQTPSVIVNSDAGNGVGYTGIRIRGSDAGAVVHAGSIDRRIGAVRARSTIALYVHNTDNGSTSTVTRRRTFGISASAASSARRMSARRVPFNRNCTRCSPRRRTIGAGAGPRIVRPAVDVAGPMRRTISVAVCIASSKERPRTMVLINATIGGYRMPRR